MLLMREISKKAMRYRFLKAFSIEMGSTTCVIPTEVEGPQILFPGFAKLHFERIIGASILGPSTGLGMTRDVYIK